MPPARHMTLAPYVRILGRGPSKSRPLTREEACEAMHVILSGDADPEAVGALLMLMRYRGESPDEVAGFVDAFRAPVAPWGGLDVGLDWPSYAAGKSRGLPLFLLSAKLVAAAGYRVLLHGWNSYQKEGADVRGALPHVGITQANGPDAAVRTLDRHGLVYVPLEALDPRFLTLLKLRDVLGLRSAVNTCLRLLNPTLAENAVQGAFHPPYRPLQRDAAKRVGLSDIAVIKGAGGEFEWTGMKSVRVFRLIDGTAFEEDIPPCIRKVPPQEDKPLSAEMLATLWQSGRPGTPAVDTILATAALALSVLSPNTSWRDLYDHAKALWHARQREPAARSGGAL